jgi:phosphopantothenoylcysteine synthetase/decarboxylase
VETSGNRQNISLLLEYGVQIIPVEPENSPADWLRDGRMAEPENIVAFVDSWFKRRSDLPLAG